MKEFKNPEMDMVRIEVEDVITTSGITGGDKDSGTGGGGVED